MQWFISEMTVDHWGLLLDLATTVLAAGAFVYSWRQLNLTTSPRVYIAGVRVEGLKHGEWPVFFVTLANDGNGPAKDVEINLRVEGETNAENIAGHKWSRPQRVTIQANSQRDFFVTWTHALHEQGVERFESAKAGLLVMGHFTHAKQRQDFKYRYYPWPGTGQRPEGVPQFIPVDFDPGTTVLIKSKGSAKIQFDAKAYSAATQEGSLPAE
jgi:hypothetical protein